MTSIDWDRYFHTRYKPVGSNWGEKDLQKYRRWYTPWIPYMFRSLPTFVGKTGLELGAGIGAVSSLLADRGVNMIASDISKEMVAAGKEVLSPIPYIYLDILKPQHMKPVDLVVAIEVLEHLPDVKKGINNIKKLLNKNGWFVGTTPFPYAKNMTDPTHVNVHPPEYWKQLFVSLNFSQIKILPLSVLPLTWRISLFPQFIIPHYTSLPLIISTTVILAKN